MNILGVIHARGGSKRIPFKNIKLLGGKPLISYSINAAKNSKLINRLIVSTDHPDIITISKEYGAEVPFVRPKELAEDVPSELVTQHAVTFLEEKENLSIDVAVTIQPTTPFFISDDIDSCIRLVTEKGFDSSFTVKIVRERPEWMFRLSGDSAEPFMGGIMQGERGVFQSLEKLYIPNGAVYVTKKEALFREAAIITKYSSLYVMPDERSVDIDEPIDFIFAEFLINQKG